MSLPITLAAVSATAGTPTPIYTGAVTTAVSFSISNNVATIVLAALPATGYAVNNSVTLWGFTTGTYFNGQTVSVIRNTPTSFSFDFTHGNVSSTNDTGSTGARPVERFRGVHIEADKGNTTHFIYVGDGNVSASRYTTQLVYGLGQSPPVIGQEDIWFGGPENFGQNIDASRIFIDTDNTGSKAQVTLFV